MRLSPLDLLRTGSRCAAGLILVGFCSCAMAAPFSVAVVLSEQSESYKAIFTTLQRKLGGSNVKLSQSDGQEPIRDASLIVAVGVRAANALPPTNVPVLYVLLPKSTYDTLAKMRKLSGPNIRQSVVYLEQPAARQVHLLAAALPRHDRVGILSSSSTRDETDRFSREARRHNLNIYATEMNGQAHLSDVLPNVLENCDVLLALPDAAIYNSATIRNVLLSSYRRGKPLIGFSAGLVNAGALAAVFSTPEQFGVQVAAMIERYTNTGTLPPPQYPQLFEVAVNKVVASSLGLDLKDARVIEAELERREPVRHEDLLEP